MHQYKVILSYGTFFIQADYYSIIRDNYQFWIGTRIVVSYPVSDVIDILVDD